MKRLEEHLNGNLWYNRIHNYEKAFCDTEQKIIHDIQEELMKSDNLPIYNGTIKLQKIIQNDATVDPVYANEVIIEMTSWYVLLDLREKIVGDRWRAIYDMPDNVSELCRSVA